MVDVKAALLDPTSVFRTPQEVLNCAELSKEQKIKILLQWSYDARELQVAEEENMLGTSSSENMLQQVLKALISLGYDITKKDDATPTKQG